MSYYQFELDTGTISTGQVKNTVADCGYPSDQYTYDQVNTKQVNVTPNAGAPGMAPTTLEHAYKKKYGKQITLTYVNGKLEAPDANVGTPYSIIITMTQSTVTVLENGDFSLLAWKSVQASASGGVPVVWYSSQTFGPTKMINWQESYQGYTSKEGQIHTGQILAANAYDMTLGQTLSVTGQSGTGEVMNGGVATAITIANQSGVPFTCGISQAVGATANPLCAFPLYGSAAYQIAPIEKVLLMFAAGTINTGQVIYNALTTGIMIDLTADNSRTVAFDINSGWNWRDAGWGQSVGYDCPLTPLLIDTVEQARRHTLVGL